MNALPEIQLQLLGRQFATGARYMHKPVAGYFEACNQKRKTSMSLVKAKMQANQTIHAKPNT